MQSARISIETKSPGGRLSKPAEGCKDAESSARLSRCSDVRLGWLATIQAVSRAGHPRGITKMR